MSKVVHMRIPDHILIACYDALHEVGGMNTDNIPVSSIVVQALSAMVKGLRNQEVLESYTNSSDMMRKLHHYLGAEDSMLGATNMGLDFSGAAEDDFDSGQIVRQFVDEAVERMSDGGIPTEFEQQSVEATKEPEMQIDFQLIQTTPFDDLASVAPRDKFILAAELDTTLRMCIEIVYHSLPPELWGSDTAERSIQSIYQQVETYINESEPETED